MTDGATQRPWKVHNARAGGGLLGSINDTGIVGNVDGVPMVLGETWVECVGPNNSKTVANARANAELIVRAVNSHDQLVAALRRAIRYFDEAEQHREAWGKMVDDFRAALAAAEADR